MVPRVEPAEQEGMFRVYAPARSTKAPREDASVSREGQEENAPSYTLMDGEQMTAYLQAFVSEQVESDILYTQHLLAGDVTVSQALAQGRFDAAEVITRTVTDEQTGAERVVIAPETLGQMKARADMAMAAIRALEAEGVSYEDAAARMDASLSEHLPLGTLVKTWEEAQERIRTEQARNPEFKVPAMDAPFSNAYVTKVRRGDTFRRVLRYARGNATVEDLMDPPKKYFRLAPGRTVRLRGGYCITCTDYKQDAEGTITEIFCEHIPGTIGSNPPEGIQCRAAIHWVSTKYAVDGEIRIYDRLFTEENPDAAEEGFLSVMNPSSLAIITNAKLEPSLAGAEPEFRCQFERLGYFVADRRDHVPGRRPVFNRTVALKDSWAKKQK